jgi:hypothetical protein
MSKLLDSQSSPSTKTELDIFTVPPTQVAIDGGFWQACKPVNTVTDKGPYEFHLYADTHYVQLNKNYLYIKLKLIRVNGTKLTYHKGPPPVYENVAPINLLGKTLFNHVKVYLGGKLGFDSGDMYAYRAYIETELNYGWEAKNTHLTAALYFKDTPSSSINTSKNTGWQKRRFIFSTSDTVELMAPIHCDFFMTDRLMLNHTDIRLELHRNSDAFSVMAFDNNPNYMLKIEDMVWYVKKVEVLASIDIAIQSMLTKHAAKYPLRRVEMTRLHVAAQRRSTPTNVLFTGQIPRRLVIGCVDSDAFYGTFDKSPFLFDNYDIQQMRITAGGIVYPREPLRMNFDSYQYARPYIQLFEAMEQAKEDKGNNISLDDFKNSTCLFVFDLTQDEQDGNHWDLMKEGSTALDITFAKDIPNADGIEVIVYAEFDNLMILDRNRNFYFDYNS